MKSINTLIDDRIRSLFFRVRDSVYGQKIEKKYSRNFFNENYINKGLHRLAETNEKTITSIIKNNEITL